MGRQNITNDFKLLAGESVDDLVEAGFNRYMHRGEFTECVYKLLIDCCGNLTLAMREELRKAVETACITVAFKP